MREGRSHSWLLIEEQLIMDVQAKNNCKLCGKIFRDENNLKRHQQRKKPCIIQINPHDALNNPNKCIYCNRVFSKKANLNRHLNSCSMKNGGVDELPDPNMRIAEQLRILNEEREKEKEEREREKEEQKKKDEKHEQEIADLRTMMKSVIFCLEPNEKIFAGLGQ